MTQAPVSLIGLQAKLVANLHTTNLGIAGDLMHQQTGGYHIGANTLRANGMSGDYSLHYSQDQVNSDWACAFDIGGTPEVLQLLGNRILNALVNKDPRVYGFVRAVNAPFGGHEEDRRYDCEDPKTALDDNLQTSEDRGHIHVEVYRSLVLNQVVMDGIYAVFAGIPPSTPVKPPTTSKDTDVAELIQFVAPSPVRNKKAIYVHSNHVCVRWVRTTEEVASLLRLYGQKKVTPTAHSRAYYGQLVGPDPEPKP